MKLFLFLIGLLAALQVWSQDPAYPTAPATPQNLVSAEYFFDTDPGFGAATAITVTPGVTLSNVAATVNTAGLANGIHRFYLRTRNADGKWSITNVTDFLVDFNPGYPTSPTAPQNLNRAEYFIDTDPGMGNGTAIPVTPGTDLPNVAASINTAGLSNGIHRIYIRTQSADGKWSITNIKDFLVDFNPAYPASPVAPQNIVRAEYFFDTDPGFGNGATIAISPATNVANVTAATNTAGLSIGVHRIYVRTQSADGKWSISNLKDFLVDENPAYPTPPAAPGNLVFAEYFFDTDPGWGNGTAIPFSAGVNLSDVTFSANVAALSQGNHQFFIRTLDDWSITGYQTFLKGSPLPLRLLSFYAKNADRSVALDWKTDNELNTAYFDVERSADGLRFTKISTVPATNGAGIQAYALSDVQPLEGKGFYRLKQVDKDGKAEYSTTLLVNRSKAGSVQLFPNPATNKLTILFPLHTAPQTITLLNATGQLLRQANLPAGSTTVELPLTDLRAGAYFIKWQGNNQVVVKPFTKQ